MPFNLIQGDDLHAYPHLANQMFGDRRAIFKERLGWALDSDAEGRERDAYDSENPLYLIQTDEAGRHLGSTRLMPTTGPTMIADHFSHLTDGVAVASATIWEVTRFHVSKLATRRSAPGLMWAGCEFARRAGVSFYVGVTGAHMVRVFTACGWAPEVIGRGESAEGEIVACLWEVSEALTERLAERAGIDPATEHLEIARPRPAEPLRAAHFAPPARPARPRLALAA